MIQQCCFCLVMMDETDTMCDDGEKVFCGKCMKSHGRDLKKGRTWKDAEEEIVALKEIIRKLRRSPHVHRNDAITK